MTVAEEWDKAFLKVLPIASLGLGIFSTIMAIMTFGRSNPLQQRVYSEDGKYLVSVRFPGQWHDLRDFIQPSNPDVLAVYFQYGPDPQALFDFVCRNIDYRRDIGEFWLAPSETLARGLGDCEDTSFLLTSLIRAGGSPSCYVALGSLSDYGHAWCVLEGQILETTYTRARIVPDPENYDTFVLFNEQEVIELWPGALSDLFTLARDEELKLSLMAKTLEAVC